MQVNERPTIKKRQRTTAQAWLSATIPANDGPVGKFRPRFHLFVASRRGLHAVFYFARRWRPAVFLELSDRRHRSSAGLSRVLRDRLAIPHRRRNSEIG